MNAPPVLAGAKAISAYLNLTVRQTRNWIDKGWIPTFRLGGVICARPADIDRALAEHAEAGALSTEASAEEKAKPTVNDLTRRRFR